MKDLSVSVIVVLALALGIGMAFHWVYPLVEITSDIAALFVFLALVLRLVLSKLWSLRQKPASPADVEAHK
jgi:hypothetical protein